MTASTPDLAASPELAETIRYLSSEKAQVSIRANHYAPKWEAPWWRMILLHEMGMTKEIPRVAVSTLLSALKAYGVPDFPEVPHETWRKGELRWEACHCELGMLFQVLSAYGVDVDLELPWIRPWFLRYQLPDGGLNCEATTYSKAAPKSSLVSTLPPLEAVLIHTHRAFTPAEEQFLDRGASYLIERRLFRARGQGNRVMDPEWLKPVFPRFWAYDILRGLSWLARWAEVRGKPLPADSVREAIDTVRSQVVDGGMTVGRRLHDRTMRCDADGTWTWGHPTSTFPLLDACSAVGAASPYLGQIWRATHERLERLRANGQLDSLS